MSRARRVRLPRPLYRTKRRTRGDDPRSPGQRRSKLTTIGLIVSLAAILIAAYLCTNAVEILGDRLGLSQGGAGSVLAALGTALPETLVLGCAIIFKKTQGR
jgi:Ca2+/H+ antiporter